MLLRRSLLLLIIFITTISFAQSEKSQNIIAEFKGQKITWEEFEKAYKKNDIITNSKKEETIQKLRDFLTLYVNYKMKLYDGIQRGIADDPEVKAELDGYKKQITYTYYLEKYLVQPVLKKLYERRKWELRASHIMFVAHNGNDAEVPELANAVLDSVKNGADFAEMAKRYSQDNFSKNIGGDFYYITAGQLPKVLDEALYNTKVGQVYPQIVKSDFGYHIFKLTEKHLRRARIRASHILIRYDHNGKPDTARAKAMIDTVYQKLKNGENFEKLVYQYSMDPGSEGRNGDLGYFTRNQMVRPFDNAVFNLKNVGDLSGIVQTQFGYHIIKLTGISPYPSFEEDRENLLKIMRSRQYNEYYYELLDSLASENNYVENKNTYNYLAGILDTAKANFDLSSLPDSVQAQTLFTVNNQTATIKDYIEYRKLLNLEKAQDLASMPFDKSLLSMAGNQIILREEPRLEKNEPEFRELLDDFKKGTIIFKLQQLEVWNKITADSISLLNYFNENAEKYKWNDRVKFTEIFSNTDSLLNLYQQMVEQGESFDSVAAKYTERPTFREKAGNFGWRDVNFSILSEEANKLKNVGDISGFIPNFGGDSILRLDGKDPAHLKTFEEARNEVTADFQEYQTKKAEQAYLNKLKNKYNPIIYYDKIEKLYK